MSKVSPDDLAARGRLAEEKLLTVEGGLWGSADVVAHLKVTRQAVSHRRHRGQLMAVPIGGTFAFFAWQFTEGGTLDGLAEMLAILDKESLFQKVRFFVSTNVALDGRRPLDLMREHNLEPVRRAARLYHEQGAP